jgi:hypothetical protein
MKLIITNANRTDENFIDLLVKLFTPANNFAFSPWKRTAGFFNVQPKNY